MKRYLSWTKSINLTTVLLRTGSILARKARRRLSLTHPSAPGAKSGAGSSAFSRLGRDTARQVGYYSPTASWNKGIHLLHAISVTSGYVKLRRDKSTRHGRNSRTGSIFVRGAIRVNRNAPANRFSEGKKLYGKYN
jgi:hypothetical protein